MKTKEITIEQFEKFVPVAMSKDDYIFEACKDAIEMEQEDLEVSLLGDLGIDAYENSDTLERNFVALVCCTAFLDRMRSLDVVLTSTGFGVVSTQDTAPASQERVNNVEREIRNERMRRLNACIRILKNVAGWGTSECGMCHIPHICWDYYWMMSFMGVEEKTEQKWWSVQPQIREAVDELRKLLSHELMDKLRDEEAAPRIQNSIYSDLALKCKVAVSYYVIKDMPAWKQRSRDILDYVEKNLDSFPEYRDSETYEAHHTPLYQNDKESKMFVFGH